MHNTRKLLSVLTALCLLVGLVPFAALPAAAEDVGTTVLVDNADDFRAALEKGDPSVTVTASFEVSSSVTACGDTTLTINSGCTVTVKGEDGPDQEGTEAPFPGWDAVTVKSGKTLTLAGPGTLIAAGGAGGNSSGFPGGAGGCGISISEGGKLTVTGGTLIAAGGVGGEGGYESPDDEAPNVGGHGISGAVEVSGGKVEATGGAGGGFFSAEDAARGGHGLSGSLTLSGDGDVEATGGAGGENTDSGDGGDGGCGLSGSLALSGGILTATGGAGGKGGSNTENYEGGDGGPGGHGIYITEDGAVSLDWGWLNATGGTGGVGGSGAGDRGNGGDGFHSESDNQSRTLLINEGGYTVKGGDGYFGGSGLLHWGNAIALSDAALTATGGNGDVYGGYGLICYGNPVYLNGGELEATGGTNQEGDKAYGIYGAVTLNGGALTATGSQGVLADYVTIAEGFIYRDEEHNGPYDASTEINDRMVNGYTLSAAHEISYPLNDAGATVTAACALCEGKTASVTIVAPKHTRFGDGLSPEAQLDGWEAFAYFVGVDAGTQNILYIEGEKTLEDDEFTYDPPTAAGDYTAYLISGDATAWLTYTIDPKTVADPVIVLSQTSYTADSTEKKPGVTVYEPAPAAVGVGEDIGGGDVGAAHGTLIPAEEYTVSYSDNVKAGTATVTITDKAGGNYAVSGSTTFTINAPEQYSAPVSFWSPGPSTFPISLDPTEHGTLTVSPERAAAGSTVGIQAVPEEGWRLDDIAVKRADNQKPIPLYSSSPNDYSFTAPDSAVAVSARFAPDTVTGGLPKAVLSPQRVMVNDMECALEAYNIGGNNYFRLRDLAAMLSGTPAQFNVEYDAARNAVVITKGAAYNGMVGTSFTDNSASMMRSPQAVFIDGAPIPLTAYNIGGYNFFGLRELSMFLGYSVCYNEATNTAIIESK